MNYWLDPFSGETWQAFQASGAKVTGFRKTHWQRARNVKPGDVLLCYLLRVKRWIGLLEVTTGRFRSDSANRQSAPADRQFAAANRQFAGDFPGEGLPVRLGVKPIVALPPEHGVPMASLEGRLSFYKQGYKPNQWIAHVRRSLTRYKQSDGDVIAGALREAAVRPTVRPVDPKKLARSPTLYTVATPSVPFPPADPQSAAANRRSAAANRKSAGNCATREVESVVTIPTSEEEQRPDEDSRAKAPTHTEIQWRLLDLGVQLGLDVWAPRSDRGKTWSAGRIGDLRRLLQKLPSLFNICPPILKTIENIDVLWLKEGSITAAFEVEHTTTIYSGLLRLSDLITMSPLVGIRLYLVAPDDRFPTFMREVARPTFASRQTPLHTLCGFLPYSTLCKRLEDGKDLIRFLKPEFLDDIAEFYDPAEEVDA